MAIIKAHGHGTTTGKANNRHFDSEARCSALLCVGAKVALEGKKSCPIWGLHDGPCGTVKEIIFPEGKNPNHGDLTLYVVVDFPLYCGPTWDIDNPKSIPIPLAEYNCKYSSPNRQCCKRKFVPLCLAYARTIHRFGGMSAGPVEHGKIPNMFKYIICDPHNRYCERSALGLFYTALSRATTLGDSNGRGSAIYFTGENYNEQRIRNIGKRNGTDDECKRVKQRKRWVTHLKSNMLHSSVPKVQRKDLLEWAETFKVTHNDLYEHIQQYITQKQKTSKKQTARTIAS